MIAIVAPADNRSISTAISTGWSITTMMHLITALTNFKFAIWRGLMMTGRLPESHLDELDASVV